MVDRYESPVKIWGYPLLAHQDGGFPIEDIQSRVLPLLERAKGQMGLALLLQGSPRSNRTPRLVHGLLDTAEIEGAMHGEPSLVVGFKTVIPDGLLGGTSATPSHDYAVLNSSRSTVAIVIPSISCPHTRTPIYWDPERLEDWGKAFNESIPATSTKADGRALAEAYRKVCLLQDYRLALRGIKPVIL